MTLIPQPAIPAPSRAIDDEQPATPISQVETPTAETPAGAPADNGVPAKAKKSGGKKAVAKAPPKPKAKADKPKAKISLEELEAELVKKYKGKQDIVPHSLRQAGAIESFGNKRTIKIKCQGKGCEKERRIATSDLHQTNKCEDCIKQDRLDRRKSNRKSKAKAKPAKVQKVKVKTPKAAKPAPAMEGAATAAE